MKRTVLIILLMASLALSGCSGAPDAQTTDLPEPAQETAASMPAAAPEMTPEPAATPETTPTPEEIFSDAVLTREYFSSGEHDIRAVDTELLLKYPVLREYYIEAVPFDIEEAELRETPDSSCFSAIGYCAVRELLAVRFRSGGPVYLYAGVTPEVWEDFSSASSLGRYYNAWIKPSYEAVRWEK